MSRQHWRGQRGVKTTVIWPLEDKRFAQATLHLPDSMTDEDIDMFVNLIDRKVVEVFNERKEIDGGGQLQDSGVNDSQREPSEPAGAVS